MNLPRDEEDPASNMKKSQTENLVAEEEGPNNNVEEPTTGCYKGRGKPRNNVKKRPGNKNV